MVISSINAVTLNTGVAEAATRLVRYLTSTAFGNTAWVQPLNTYELVGVKYRIQTAPGS